MSLETQIASLVTAANNLTGAVNGKMGQIDQKISASEAAYLLQLEDLKKRLPRLAATKNFRMMDADANGAPESFGMHFEVTPTLVNAISNLSEAAGRPADDIALLAQIEADVREVYPDFDIRKSSYYRSPFNVWKYTWSALSSGSSGYLIYPYAADQVDVSSPWHVPNNSYLTMGAFVRVVEGALSNNYWATGNKLGKWRWCSNVLEPNRSFGSYTALHPIRQSTAGVVEVALVGCCTGVVTHPGAWGALMSL